jgi:hypothetical protein
MNQLTSGKRPVWSKDNDDAVQLFRDIYFEKYPTGTRATVVYNDPKRSYGKYNKDGFARHFKSTLEKVSTFKTFGTGLSESFRHRCRLNVRPDPEDRASKITEKKHGEDNKESDDEDDESYDDSGEEDVTLVSELDDESFVESIKNKTKKSTVPIAKKAVTTPVATSMPREAVTNEVPLLSPQLVNCQGGFWQDMFHCSPALNMSFLLRTIENNSCNECTFRRPSREQQASSIGMVSRNTTCTLPVYKKTLTK